MSCTREPPILGLATDLGHDVCRRSNLVVEYSCVALVPKFPCDKHCQRGRGPPATKAVVYDGKPPSLDVLKSLPRVRVETLHVHPIFDLGPDLNGESALEEEVCRGLGHPIAERAVSAIWPSTLGEAVGRPYPVL